jgi:hypothetical protein
MGAITAARTDLAVDVMVPTSADAYSRRASTIACGRATMQRSPGGGQGRRDGCAAARAPSGARTNATAEDRRVIWAKTQLFRAFALEVRLQRTLWDGKVRILMRVIDRRAKRLY